MKFKRRQYNKYLQLSVEEQKDYLLAIPFHRKPYMISITDSILNSFNYIKILVPSSYGIEFDTEPQQDNDNCISIFKVVCNYRSITDSDVYSVELNKKDELRVVCSNNEDFSTTEEFVFDFIQLEDKIVIPDSDFIMDMGFLTDTVEIKNTYREKKEARKKMKDISEGIELRHGLSGTNIHEDIKKLISK